MCPSSATSSPFGSNEFIFQEWGIEGVHPTLEADGLRKLTPQGEADISGLVYGFSVADLYIYLPGYPDQAKERQHLIELSMPIAVKNPTLGLYSEKNTTEGPAINEYVSDTVNDVIFGRKGIEELATVQEEWRKRGGDDIRKEYEELLKAQSGG